jgi:serine/threonine-protein kinase
MHIDTDINNQIDVILSSLDNKYQVLEEIGRGGQKRVFKIKNELKQTSVLKIIATTKESLDRARREIRASTIIDHANIPKIISSNVDVSTEDEKPLWIIEEYINGLSLRKQFENRRKFFLKDVISLIETMLSILIKAEEKKIIHRDVKPENILLDVNNSYWLIDFGIARHLDLESLTESNSPFGPCTIGYSSPEQFKNLKHDIDIRADLFSLGVVVAEMIIGYNPYIKGSDNILSIIKNIERQPLPLLRIEGDSRYLLARFIKTLGDNRISRRPSSAHEAYELFNLIKPTLIL